MTTGFKTIFIIGNPRSGKTVLQNLLGLHPALAWFSQYHYHFPKCPLNSLLRSCTDFPFYTHPEEMRKDFTPTLARDGSLEATDAKTNDKKILRALFTKELYRQKKSIFLTDYGRPARISYFNAIFPGSYFIHVLRDGRQVAAELLATRAPWYTPNKDLHSFYSHVPLALDRLLTTYRHTPYYTLALIALRWRLAIMEIERQKSFLEPSHFLLIHYEDLLANQLATCQKTLRFINLDFPSNLKHGIKRRKLKTKDWTKDLNQSQKDLLQKLLSPTLKKYHYL